MATIKFDMKQHFSRSMEVLDKQVKVSGTRNPALESE